MHLRKTIAVVEHTIICTVYKAIYNMSKKTVYKSLLKESPIQETLTQNTARDGNEIIELRRR